MPFAIAPSQGLGGIIAEAWPGFQENSMTAGAIQGTEPTFRARMLHDVNRSRPSKFIQGGAAGSCMPAVAREYFGSRKVADDKARNEGARHERRLPVCRLRHAHHG